MTFLTHIGFWRTRLLYVMGIIGLGLCFLTVACGLENSTEGDIDLLTSSKSFNCGLLTIPFTSTVPGDAFFSNQTDADCFGWWEFIALNWPTEPDSGFGDPGDQGEVQWQTYMASELLFQPKAATPPPWGTQPSIPPDCQSQAQLSAEEAESIRLLQAASKFTSNFANEFDFPSSIDEAFPGNAPNWLGAQNGTNIWYEIRVNQDEYNYVVNNQFYNANQQAVWVNNGNGQPIVLPKGSSQSGGPTGAIELKAAWMEVTDPQNAQWQRYKISPAVVIDPMSNACRSTLVALVGFHIIHKTQSQPTWIWATFEHVDNVPGSSNSNGPYNFYNPSCQSQQIEVPAACLPEGKTSPVTVSCVPNTPPPYYLGDGCPGPVPIQVSRTIPIDNNTQQLNASVQAAIAENFPNSVWQYYQLVNVIWSSSPTQDPKKPMAVPLSLSSMLPTVKVANVALETYAQNLTCTDCHRFATIAPTNVTPKPQWDADFSFAIGSAGYP